MPRRLKFLVCYDGTEYHGWQVQPNLITIQSTLQDVLSEIEGSRVKVEGSGRTDAGVHALAQTAACTLENPIPIPNLRKAFNRLLPRDIRITHIEEATADFHPRFNAIAKTYQYRIWRDEICSPFERRYVYHYPYPLNEPALIEAAGVYAGVHDFTAFAAADEKDAKELSRVRTIFSSTAERTEHLLVYTVRGSGFLKHMVRNLMGFLLEVGKGNLSRQDLQDMLDAGRKQKHGYSVPAHGLHLMNVEY